MEGNKDQRFSRRDFLKASAGVVGLTALAACAPADTDTAATGDGSAPDQASAGPIDLTFWTFVTAHADYYMNQVERYNESAEVQINLEATNYPYDEMHDQLLIALQSGTGAPDIVDIEIAKFGTFLRGDIQLHDLTDLIDRNRENIIEARLAPYQYQGSQYGIPTHLGAWVMYYNNAILDDAGVDVDSIESWDDFVAAGETVTDADNELWMTSIESGGRLSILGMMLQNGGGVYDADGNMILDSDANIEALSLARSMVHDDQIARVPPGTDHHATEYYESMNAGGFAAVSMPQWYMIRFTEFMPDLEGNILVRPLPTYREDGFTTTMGGGTGTAITRQIESDKVESTKDFLEQAKLTYEANVRIWTEFGFDPFRSDVYDDERLLEPLSYFGNEPVLENINGILDNMAPAYLGPRYPEAVERLGDIVAYEVIEEGVDPAEVLTRMADEIRALDA